MKMAKASERDIDAAGNLMSLLHQIDRGDYPNLDEDAEVPEWFDVDDHEHLRAFYDAVMFTLEKAPGYPGRVIGGMCYVIMFDKNEIVDPNSDTLDLHPKIVKALESVSSGAPSAEDARADSLEQLLIEHRIGMTPEYEGGWNAYVYRDSEAFECAGFGATPSAAVKAALKSGSDDVREGAHDA